jgi:hypothetical protein
VGGISAGEAHLTTRGCSAVALTVLLLAGAAPAAAQAAPTAAPEYRNIAGLLMAATLVEGDAGATFGLAYEHRLGRWYGVGAFADYLTTSSRNVALGVSFHLHPTRAIKILLAPGVDFRRVGPDLVLLRMGVGYEFPLGRRWALSPEVDIDFEGGYRIYVVGVQWGWRF